MLPEERVQAATLELDEQHVRAAVLDLLGQRHPRRARDEAQPAGRSDEAFQPSAC